jgi:predicted nucleic acid-binding protein
LHAPHLIDVEIAQVVRRYMLEGDIAAELGRVALEPLADAPLQRHPHVLLLPRIWQLRENSTAYDAAYIAPAGVLYAPLVTNDRRLARGARRHIRVESSERARREKAGTA